MTAADLWVLVPSRGRPASVDRLVRACALTCQADTRLHFGFDEDDPKLEASVAAAGGHRYTVRPRMGLVAWTNELAARHVKRGDAGALASLGDDMLPVTDGWDAKLLAALPAGGGITYPDDQRRDDIPEAPVMSTAIVRELGWFFPPVFDHWFGDTALGALGQETGCLVYCRDVLVRHLHPCVDPAVPVDGTYSDASERLTSDLAAYARWRVFDMPGCAAAVRRVREAALHSV